MTLRLLVTYAGPGTEWRVGDDGAINGLQAGDVAILKGRLLLDPPVVLHRSPPIAGCGIERVLLAIDPVTVPDSRRAAAPHGLQLLQ